MRRIRILILGGTGEARALAGRLHPEFGIVSSLAGRVPDPALPVGPVRLGGFGGADGLREWLHDNDITAVVDATHPFAATISANAAKACGGLRVPHLVLRRPPWEAPSAIRVAGDSEAAEVVAEKGYSRIFLTTGRSGTSAFANSDAWFLIRVVTPPDPRSLPERHELLVSRGPYDLDGERALMSGNRIDALVTLGSGAFELLAQAFGKEGSARAVVRTARGAVQPAGQPNSVLLTSQLKPADGATLPSRPVDDEQALDLNGSMRPYRWGINGAVFGENDPIRVNRGQRVRLVIRNMTMMTHPLHLHGHTFALSDSGVRKDTVLVPPMQSAS